MKMDATPIERLEMPLLTEKGVSLSIKREDLNHPDISGNKLRKLKYNLSAAKEQGHDTILTFGGAFSNHIYATAAAGAEERLKTIGIIRGEEHLPLNPTLSFAKSKGMAFTYLDRTRYRLKNSGTVLNELKRKYGRFYLIPEGGTNELAIKGCTEILSPSEKRFSHYALSVGTGGTLAGIILSLAGAGKIIGFSALKGEFLEVEVNNLFKQFNLPEYGNWNINQDYHFGGYAKITDELRTFVKEMEEVYDLPLDPIYTAKTLFGLLSLIKEDKFPVGSEILMIHTGGLQGRMGFGL
jgi:1-aminocyclopropane-1-carboxylate deaminase